MLLYFSEKLRSPITYRSNRVDYWIIKNSWGTEWADEGFGKIRRGTGQCGIGHDCNVAQCQSTTGNGYFDDN